jgi:hypothetical protein
MVTQIQANYFWPRIVKDVCTYIDVEITISTAYHHQANGQTKRVNQMMEEILRHYVSHHHDNWDKLLPTVEFAYNSSKHSTTQKTPFEVIFSFNHQTDVAGAIAGHSNATNYVEQLKRNIDEARKAIIDAVTSKDGIQCKTLRHPIRRWTISHVKDKKLPRC